MDVVPDSTAGMAANDPNKIQQELMALQRQRRQAELKLREIDNKRRPINSRLGGPNRQQMPNLQERAERDRQEREAYERTRPPCPWDVQEPKKNRIMSSVVKPVVSRDGEEEDDDEDEVEMEGGVPRGPRSKKRKAVEKEPEEEDAEDAYPSKMRMDGGAMDEDMADMDRRGGGRDDWRDDRRNDDRRGGGNRRGDDRRGDDRDRRGDDRRGGHDDRGGRGGHDDRGGRDDRDSERRAHKRGRLSSELAIDVDVDDKEEKGEKGEGDAEEDGDAKGSDKSPAKTPSKTPGSTGSAKTPSSRGTDPRARNRKMFGNLLGHLKKAKKQEEELSGSAVMKKRHEIEEQAVYKASAETERLRVQVRVDQRELRQANINVIRDVRKKQGAALHALALSRAQTYCQNLSCFIQTVAQPAIFWKPKVIKITGGGTHSKMIGETRDKMDAQHEEVKALLGAWRVAELEEEAARDAEIEQRRIESLTRAAEYRMRDQGMGEGGEGGEADGGEKKEAAAEEAEEDGEGEQEEEIVL